MSQRTKTSGIKIEASGELAKRIELTARRLLEGDLPRFTLEFVLADVTLDERRRFSNFSGDLSGRYIGALACLPPQTGAAQLDALVHELINHQKADGRFGDDALQFTAEEIGNEHMALLWGNGRLLAGLTEFYAARRDETALAAARRLGDFLVAVCKQCSEPEVARRVEGQGAFGFICFTQLIEGLVLLAEAADERRYLDTAREILPTLPARGIEHSHGWLSTLRGAVMLYEAAKDESALSFAEERFRELLASRDYTFFGHRVSFAHGVKPTESVGRAWWCCTMHGYRAFPDALDAVVTSEDGAIKVNLFLGAEWSDDRLALLTMSSPTQQQDFIVVIERGSEKEIKLAIRQPGWSETLRLSVNGLPVNARRQDGYLIVKRVWQAGDRLNIGFAFRERFQARDGRAFTRAEIGDEPFEAALYHGPYLMGVDDTHEPLFFSEPWPTNVIHLPREREAGLEWRLSYTHESVRA